MPALELVRSAIAHTGPLGSCLDPGHTPGHIACRRRWERPIPQRLAMFATANVRNRRPMLFASRRPPRRQSARHRAARAGRRCHVRRGRFLGGGGASQARGPRCRSASPCSSTIMARRWDARAPAAPARTSTTPAASPTGSASPTTSSTTSSASRPRVMQAFADSYAAGETPIPCVTLQPADQVPRAAGHRPLELGAEALATGHYIELRDGAVRARAVSGPRCRPRPELLPVRHHARPARPR